MIELIGIIITLTFIACIIVLARRIDKLSSEIYKLKTEQLEPTYRAVKELPTYQKVQKSFYPTNGEQHTLDELYEIEKKINKIVNTKLPKKKQTERESIKEAEEVATLIATFKKATKQIYPELASHDNNI
ncbi:hypothetical protein LCGC14_1653910 [marine sediment metagenome]|uniref:Uncharacterized protein n=1 Tax=marine sediment metagenome TaxID=412755 RepID=A0A0F9IIN0_9ZZZZ